MTCTYCDQQFLAEDLKDGLCDECRIVEKVEHGVKFYHVKDGFFSSLDMAENYRQRKVGF
jgi:hypothetical protein